MDSFDTIIQQRDAFQHACTDHEDPRLWRITWAESLLDDLLERAPASESEDPSAQLEAERETREMFRLLREALRKLQEATL